MTPSTVPTPDTVQSRHSGLNAGCARRRSGRRPRLRQHPPGLTPADARSPPARPLFRPNRVHFRLGPVFCLGQLPTSHRCDAVGLGYTVVARFNCTQTFTGWFHGFISARSAPVSGAFGCRYAHLLQPGSVREYRALHCASRTADSIKAQRSKRNLELCVLRVSAVRKDNRAYGTNGTYAGDENLVRHLFHNSCFRPPPLRKKPPNPRSASTPRRPLS